MLLRLSTQQVRYVSIVISGKCENPCPDNIIEKDEYSILNSKHFIGIHGYMLVYSVASKQSFEMVSIIRDKILNHLVRALPGIKQL